MAWLPIVDISRHQGAVDFTKMRAAGVTGVIMRLSHGVTVDDRFAVYWRAALAAGYTTSDLAVYTFVNPKRGTADQCAAENVRLLEQIVGTARVGFMLDCESYAAEGPNSGQAPVRGAAYARYVRRYRDLMADAGAHVFGYTNAAFWDPFVGDAALAAELDWLVPRYPVHSTLGYLRYPLPASPSGWADWAFARASGPYPPRGARGWAGWQFSADWNRQGSRYGASSSALDLNIVDADAWARWTGTKEGLDTMQYVGERLTPNPVPIEGGKTVTIQTGYSGDKAIVNIATVTPAADGWVKVWTTGQPPVIDRLGYHAGDIAPQGDLLVDLAFGTFKIQAKTDLAVSIDLVYVADGAVRNTQVTQGISG